MLEQYFASVKENIKVVVNQNKLDEVKGILRFVFDDYQNVSELYGEVTNALPEFEEGNNPIRIVDLNEKNYIIFSTR